MRQVAAGASRSYTVTGGRTIPNYKEFMAVSSNKQQLVHHITKYVCTKCPAQMQTHRERALFIAGGCENGVGTVSCTSAGVTVHNNLFSSQEEADTRLLFHVIQCDMSFAKAGILKW